MTKTAYTPGPWRKEDDEYIVVAGDGFSICDTAPGNPIDVSHAAAKANAKLIAAAPELLNALHRAVEVMQFAYMNAPKQPKEIDEALAVIAKAEGR